MTRDQRDALSRLIIHMVSASLSTILCCLAGDKEMWFAAIALGAMAIWLAGKADRARYDFIGPEAP